MKWLLVMSMSILIWQIKSNDSMKCSKLDRFCYCDSKCRIYNDCCDGYNDKILYKLEYPIAAYTCQLYHDVRIWVVDKCADKSHKFRLKCENTSVNDDDDIKARIPVFNEDTVFKNAYCGLCNGIKMFKHVSSDINCSKEIILKDLVKSYYKYKYQCIFIPKIMEIVNKRYCFTNLIRNCNNSNHQLQRNCSRHYFNLWSDGSNMYRNEYCCKCNSENCQPAILNSPLNLPFNYIYNFNEWSESIENSTEAKNEKSFFYYIPIIFTILSILSLVLLILIYSFDKGFHNFTGAITISLSSCLLIFKLMVLPIVLLEPSKLLGYCGLLSLLQHYFVLTHFFWMLIYAVDLLQTFVHHSMCKSVKSKKLFIVYSVICYIGPLLIVIPPSLLDRIQDNGTILSLLKPGFNSSHCWFSNKTGGLIWMFFPVCLILITNIIICVVVLRKIVKSLNERSRMNMNEQSLQETVWICIRLTIIVGAGYFILIIAIVSKQAWFITVGTMLNCLQGFLLSICFFWNKRVRNKIGSSFRKLTSNITSRTNTTKVTNSNLTQHTKSSHLSLSSLKANDVNVGKISARNSPKI